MCKKNNSLRPLVFVCIVIGLLSALAPLSDFDNDKLLDSLATEGFFLLLVLLRITGFIFLIRFFAAHIALPRLIFSPLVPPPISR
jgi:hypothetical protein